jgi:uncharacterized membrane protein
VTPRWLPRSTFGVALACVAVATYLTIAHYTTPNVLACSDSGFVNCATVTTSAQSTFVGIPVAVLGLGWSLVMAVLCAPAAWRSSSLALVRARLGLSVLGVGFVLWLVYAELFVIRALCIWCTVIHVLTFALFAMIALFGSTPARDDR